MYLSKLKTFLIFYGIFFILIFVISIIKGSKIPFEEFIILSLCPVILPYIIGLHKPVIKYFDKKYWENEDEKNFQINPKCTNISNGMWKSRKSPQRVNGIRHISHIFIFCSI